MGKRFAAVFGLILLFMAVWAGILAPIIILGGLQDSPEGGIVVLVALVVIIATFLPYLNFAARLAFRFKGQGEPIPLEKLKEKIQNINTLDIPVMVKEKKKKMIITWNYVNAKWWEILAKKGLNSVYELHIKFKEKSKKVILIDVQKTVQWRAGPSEIKLKGGYFRGVMLQWEISKAWGIKENFELGKIYDYKFVPTEIKNPILNEILRSGWDVRFSMW